MKSTKCSKDITQENELYESYKCNTEINENKDKLEMVTKHCKSCNHILEDKMKFCPKCGTENVKKEIKEEIKQDKRSSLKLIFNCSMINMLNMIILLFLSWYYPISTKYMTLATITTTLTTLIILKVANEMKTLSVKHLFKCTVINMLNISIVIVHLYIYIYYWAWLILISISIMATTIIILKTGSKIQFKIKILSIFTLLNILNLLNVYVSLNNILIWGLQDTVGRYAMMKGIIGTIAIALLVNKLDKRETSN